MRAGGGDGAIAARALGRARQLAGLPRCMEFAGVRALAFKGPGLSLAAYGDVAVRDSIDLDLVVRPCELDLRARRSFPPATFPARR